jgi:hypothetical protein
MTNTSPGVSVSTEYLPEGKDPVALGFTNNKPTPSKEQKSLIYLAEESRARAKAALVPPNSQ